MKKLLSLSLPVLLLILIQWTILNCESYFPSTFSLELQAQKDCSIILFYQLPDYSEKKSPPKTISGSKDFQTVRFAVPPKKITNLRVEINSLNKFLILKKINFYHEKNVGYSWHGNEIIKNFPEKNKLDFQTLDDLNLLVKINESHSSFESGNTFQSLFKVLNSKKPSLFLMIAGFLFCSFLFIFLNHAKTRKWLYRIFYLAKIKSIFGKENVFIILFFIFASISQFLSYLSIPNFILNRDGLVKYILGIDLINLFFIENIVMALLTIWILSKGLGSKIISIILFLVFCLINSFQFLSVYISNEFITEEALTNTGNIGMITNGFTIMVTVVPALLCLIVFIPLFIRHRPFSSSVKQRLAASALLLFIGIGVYCAHLIPKLFLNKKNPMEMASPIANNSPLFSIATTLWASFSNVQQQNYFAADAIVISNIEKTRTRTILDEKDLKIAKSYGFQINPQKNYPFIKEAIYYGKFPFNKKKNHQKPNVIVLFIESLSARKVAAYGVPYQGITPNIDNFAKQGMVVDEYYGHVQTTNRSLKGQMCSMYPTYGYKQWAEKKMDMGAVYCLPHVMNEEGYRTIYFSHDSPTDTHLAYQMNCYGFQESYFKQDFSKAFLNNENPVLKKNYDFWPAWGLSDHQMFRGLIHYLKNSEKEKKPFFIAMSTIETHFLLDISADGVKYKDGKQPVLNTAHNLDHAFGLFWEYFKKSPYYQNTIVVITADHSHFPDADYTPIAGPDYQKNYCDRIALIVYNPYYHLPEYYKAYATSLDFAPSLLHMLNIPNRKNPFMGLSIFTDRKAIGKNIGFTSNILYDIKREGIKIYLAKNKNPEEGQSLFKIIQYMMEIEIQDRIWKKDKN